MDPPHPKSQITTTYNTSTPQILTHLLPPPNNPGTSTRHDSNKREHSFKITTILKTHRINAATFDKTYHSTFAPPTQPTES